MLKRCLTRAALWLFALMVMAIINDIACVVVPYSQIERTIFFNAWNRRYDGETRGICSVQPSSGPLVLAHPPEDLFYRLKHYCRTTTAVCGGETW